MWLSGSQALCCLTASFRKFKAVWTSLTWSETLLSKLAWIVRQASVSCHLEMTAALESISRGRESAHLSRLGLIAIEDGLSFSPQPAGRVLMHTCSLLSLDCLFKVTLILVSLWAAVSQTYFYLGGTSSRLQKGIGIISSSFSPWPCCQFFQQVNCVTCSQ